MNSLSLTSSRRVVGEEFAVAIVDAGEGDTILVFEGLENGVCVSGVTERQCAFDV